ncbi:MAG: hypothetical protein H0X39_00860 [Actinobacteria bacterium]|nr:hypothetical protein [Actinomycetota bacterium]
MPVTYGLTASGLVVKTTDLVRQDINALLIAKFGPSFDVSDSSPDGAIAGIFAERMGQMWDLVQQVAASQDPDQATGASLDALCLLTGTFRTPARSSAVTLTLTGTAGTGVTGGSRAATLSTGQLFQTTASTILGALAAWSGSTVNAIGTRVTNAGNVYQVTVAGTSAASGGPTFSPLATGSTTGTDGTVTWRYLGGGAAAVDVLATSVNTGAVGGVAGDISVINTPVGGWAGVSNVLDAVLGNDVQSDASLRVARIAQLSAPGTGTANAVRAAVLQVAGVTSCTVFVNNTDFANVDGMPPHSVEVLALGGADADIANALYAQIAAGIAYQGTTTVVINDSQGVAQPIKFSRPSQVPIYVTINVVKDPIFYPANGDAQVALAIATYGSLQLVGKDAVAASVAAQAFKVTGVLDVPRSGSLQGALIGIAASPTSDATIVITSRQQAVWDTSRVVVNSSNGTP